LSQNEINQLANMMKSDAFPRVRNRAHAILVLFEDRRRFDEVEKVLRVPTNMVRNWAERWISEGSDGLYDFEGRGTKSLFSTAEEKITLEGLDKESSLLRKLTTELEK